MDQLINLVIIAGTSRLQRESIKAAQYVAEFAHTLPNVKVTFVDVADFHLPGDGNDPEGKDPAYTAIAEEADAFFVVTPEYNHSFPGSLKRLLDSEYEHYGQKPIAIAGASNGSWGGVRAVEQLVLAARGMTLIPTTYSVYFPRVQDIFDEKGAMKPELTARYMRNLHYAFNELLWMARAFKQAKQK
jgi:NAD(P)H-dependent FMN reductase